MVYVGGKQKLAKYIVPIIQDYINKSGYKTYVEPFVGGANVICKIKAEERIGFDVNKYLIAFLRAIAEGELSVFHLPFLSKDVYQDIRTNPERYRDSFVGYAGSMFGYSGIFLGSYVPEKYYSERLRNLIKQCYPEGYDRKSLYNALSPIKFGVSSYERLNAERCVIYCDPPYNNTYNYGLKFDSAKFWNWVRDISKKTLCLCQNKKRRTISKFCGKKNIKERLETRTKNRN